VIAVGPAENWDVQYLRLPFDLIAVAMAGYGNPINVFGVSYFA
jgi:hypothetical protein